MPLMKSWMTLHADCVLLSLGQLPKRKYRLWFLLLLPWRLWRLWSVHGSLGALLPRETVAPQFFELRHLELRSLMTLKEASVVSWMSSYWS